MKVILKLSSVLVILVTCFELSFALKFKKRQDPGNTECSETIIAEIIEVQDTHLDFAKKLETRTNNYSFILDCHSFIQGVNIYRGPIEDMNSPCQSVYLEPNECSALMKGTWEAVSEGKRVCYRIEEGRGQLEVFIDTENDPCNRLE